MNRNERTPSNRILAAFIALVPLCATLSLAGCGNSLLSAAKELQAQTVTPIISLGLANGTMLNSGGTFDFGSVTVLEAPDIEYWKDSACHS
jgi:spore coat protein U-like protein